MRPDIDHQDLLLLDLPDNAATGLGFDAEEFSEQEEPDIEFEEHARELPRIANDLKNEDIPDG